MNLASQDYAMLFDALDSLQAKDTNDFLVGSMLGMMMAKDNEQAKQRFDEESKKRKAKVGERKIFAERITMLKAKLIHMRDSNTADKELDIAAK